MKEIEKEKGETLALFNSRYRRAGTSRCWYMRTGGGGICHEKKLSRSTSQYLAAPLSLIEKSAEIENCDRELRAALSLRERKEILREKEGRKYRLQKE